MNPNDLRTYELLSSFFAQKRVEIEMTWSRIHAIVIGKMTLLMEARINSLRKQGQDFNPVQEYAHLLMYISDPSKDGSLLSEDPNLNKERLEGVTPSDFYASIIEGCKYEGIEVTLFDVYDAVMDIVIPLNFIGMQFTVLAAMVANEGKLMFPAGDVAAKMKKSFEDMGIIDPFKKDNGN